MPDLERLERCERATKYYRVSFETLEAYDALSRTLSRNGILLFPMIFLLCRALEIAMKGWIVLYQGTPVRGPGSLQQHYSHNLAVLAKEVGKYYPPVAQNLPVIRLLNDNYAGKDYEYPEGNERLVGVTPLSALAEVVKDCVEQLIAAIQRERQCDP